MDHQYLGLCDDNVHTKKKKKKKDYGGNIEEIIESEWGTYLLRDSVEISELY